MTTTTTETEKQFHGWGTQSEIDFVYRIAAGKDGIAKLRGYIAGMAKRSEFGSIDADAVLTYARDKLATLEGVAETLSAVA